VVLVPEATGWVSQGGSRHRFLLLLNQHRLLLRLRLWACGRRASVVQARRHVHSGFPVAAPDRHWRPVAQRLMRASAIIKSDPSPNSGSRLAAVGVALETSSYFSERHSRSMKTLSIQRPRPSIETLIPAATSVPVKAAPVNWLPWSVLKISGLPQRVSASSPEK
jgi:hypothetical protein